VTSLARPLGWECHPRESERERREFVDHPLTSVFGSWLQSPKHWAESFPILELGGPGLVSGDGSSTVRRTRQQAQNRPKPSIIRVFVLSSFASKVLGHVTFGFAEPPSHIGGRSRHAAFLRSLQNLGANENLTCTRFLILLAIRFAK